MPSAESSFGAVVIRGHRDSDSDCSAGSRFAVDRWPATDRTEVGELTDIGYSRALQNLGSQPSDETSSVAHQGGRMRMSAAV